MQTMSNISRHLLAFTPLLDETNLSANSQSALILETLQIYGRNISNWVCIFGDNCSTNKSTANKLRVPLLGCASHPFNLAVNFYLKDFESKLEKVSQISRKLRTVKNSAELGKKTPLRPLLRNATRWSSTTNPSPLQDLSFCRKNIGTRQILSRRILHLLNI
jgi:hypothetical protein